MSKSITSKDTTEKYAWSADSLVSEVELRRTGTHLVAYLHAFTDHPDIVKLHDLENAIHDKGWSTSFDMRNGQSVLRVTGIDTQDAVLDLLQSRKLTQGSPLITTTTIDEPQAWPEKIKRHSLRASGVIYSIGNAFYIASGLARKKQAAQIGTGIAFSAGDIMIAVFGGKDDHRQFKSLLTKLTRHLEDNGIAIPKDSAIKAEISTKGESLPEKTYDVIHEHINKIKAAAEVLGGIFYFNAGKQQGNRWKQATAIIFSLGFGSSLFIAEKKPDPDKLAHAGPWAKAWAWVQEKPLRAAGYSGLSNTLFTTIGALQERKTQMAKPGGGTDYYKYDLAASGSMLMANNLYALSNKSTGGSITSDGLINDLYGLMAQVLITVPEQKRERAIKLTVDYLGDRVEIKDMRRQIEAHLREHMTHALEENPWLKARGEQTAVTPVRAESLPKSKPQKDSTWAQQVTQGQAHTAGHSLA